MITRRLGRYFGIYQKNIISNLLEERLSKLKQSWSAPMLSWTLTPSRKHFSSSISSRQSCQSLVTIISFWIKKTRQVQTNPELCSIINFFKRFNVFLVISTYQWLLCRSWMQFYSSQRVQRLFMLMSKKLHRRFGKCPMICGTEPDSSWVKISSPTNWETSAASSWNRHLLISNLTPTRTRTGAGAAGSTRSWELWPPTSTSIWTYSLLPMENSGVKIWMDLLQVIFNYNIINKEEL